MEQNKMPKWLKWSIAGLIITVFVLVYIITHQRANVKLDKANTEKNKITAQIDSISTKRDDVIKTSKKKSQSDADKANQTIKTIDNEKLYFVHDTTYNAMCKFLANYKPTAADGK